MGWTCSSEGTGNEDKQNFGWGYLLESVHLEDREGDGKITFKMCVR
jgi:hypothetical protein